MEPGSGTLAQEEGDLDPGQTDDSTELDQDLGNSDHVDPGDLTQQEEQGPAGETGGPGGPGRSLRKSPSKPRQQKIKRGPLKTPTIKPHNKKMKQRSPPTSGSLGSPQQTRHKALRRELTQTPVTRHTGVLTRAMRKTTPSPWPHPKEGGTLGPKSGGKEVPGPPVQEPGSGHKTHKGLARLGRSQGRDIDSLE